jgi:hypothetical protein
MKPTILYLLLAACLSADEYAELPVVDTATGRGVPLVELEMVNGVRFVTDNAGRIAFREPGLMGREIFFTVRGHGYGVAKDGFGYTGVRVTPQVGKPAKIEVTRRLPAERLCRLTGEGTYCDTLLLGYKSPLPESPHPGRVAGQDSVEAAIYGGKIHWFWGDTSRMEYPLGLFRTAGATSEIPDPKSDPAAGISFDYFVDAKTGFARAMMPLKERRDGVIWISGVCVVPDETGRERLVCHYSRRKGLADELEHGIAIFDDKSATFEVAKQLPLEEKWRHLAGHPIVHEEAGKRWLLVGQSVPTVRVPATLKDVLDPSKYEAFTCARADRTPETDADGKPVWRWRAEGPPTDSPLESRWLKKKLIRPEDARLNPADAAAPGDRIVLHSGSVRWNAYRQRWVLIACQIGGKTSHLGEVWYSEATSLTGPFAKAVHIVTHDKQTFYNVCQHPFLDREDGRIIHFEGTYTHDFSGKVKNTVTGNYDLVPDSPKTPRYDYNQILYRLDLGGEWVEKTFPRN